MLVKFRRCGVDADRLISMGILPFEGRLLFARDPAEEEGSGYSPGDSATPSADGTSPGWKLSACGR